MKKVLQALFIPFLLFQGVAAQTIEIGSAADQYLRLLQLEGSLNDSLSSINRPANVFGQLAYEDSTLLSLVRTRLFWKKNKNLYTGILPLSLEQQYVSHHPFAQNDGSFIQAKGYQVRASAGFYGKAGPLFVQIKPELLWAANKQYPITKDYGYPNNKSYRKALAGQSIVGLHVGAAAVSLSTENLWWGPGIHHTLMMTNQAPGFTHIKFHSYKPYKTPIGYFEWSVLGGKLTSDSIIAFDNNDLRGNTFYKPTADRYLNAFVLNYKPVFLKGFNIGIIRALQTYWTSVTNSGTSTFSRYLPVLFKPIQKDNTQDEDLKTIDQLASAFFLWSFPKSQAEFYGEYGFNDYKANTRDFVLNFPHAAAYMIGFRKMVNSGKNVKWIGGLEITQLAQSADQLVRDAGNWYYHGGLVEGYTHQNQVLGAAFASNAQTIELVRQQKAQRSAITLQRFQRDPHRNAPRWNDWVIGVDHAQPYKGFYLNAELKGVYSRNYGWQTNSSPFQVLAKMGLRYYFHD